ncbi:MAG: single-stranded-DNA-specific exonuclease RecJ [Acidobacteriota bacterium]
MEFRWDILSSAENEVQSLAGQLQISQLLAHMLIQRGVKAPDRARAFLNPRLRDLHDPGLMTDMDRVVERIFQARDGGEKVLIYGDYDVDGMTSTVVLKRALEMLGVSVGFHLPKRLEDGYGLKREVLQDAFEKGYQLVITVDSGIRAFDVCELAAEIGLDLIITDHHLPDTRLPKAFAILNPNRPDCAYPDKDLAAVGVVFKLVHALLRREGKERLIPHFLKLVAIGTVADLVPLTGENRIIVKFGLEGLSEPHNIGLKALLEGCGVSREVNQFDIGFKLAPRINAVTRMGGEGREVIDLFSVSDRSAAESIVREMNQKNVRRREEEGRIVAEIEKRIEEHPSAFGKKFLVVSGRNWHRGVIGIVASRLVERFYRPTLVLSVGDSNCQGSGRSIPGLHLLDALDSCRDLFLAYGGHSQAVGCTLNGSPQNQERIEELSHRLDAYVATRLKPHQLVPALRIESVLPVEQLDLSFYAQIQQLAPFGMGNPSPLFASRGVSVLNGPWILKDRHLKFHIQRNGFQLDAIWWKRADWAARLERGQRVDVAYTLTQDSYQGREKLLVTIRDLRSLDI